MIDDLAIAIPLAVACVLVSAFISGTEVALFSLRRVDREQLAKSTSATDRLIVRMLERPRRLIATVLIGNEACTALLAVLALGFACQTCTSPIAAFGMALGITLPLIVLISEVTAKTLAAKAPLGWARACTGLLWLFTLAITPVRLVIGAITEVILRPLGEAARTRPARDLSEEEFRHLIDAGSAQGQVDARERRLIHRVFEFSDKNVGQVMTPRDRIFALSYDLPMQRLVRELAGRGFSRVPIYQKTLDNVRGIVNAKDLVRVAAPGQALGKPLVQVLHEPLFVPRTTPVKRLFLTFKQKKVHMAIVVSEYGKVLGIVTMDDLLGQIFGVLRDERTEMQAARRPATPAPGVPTAGSGIDTGPIPRHDPLDESRPVPRDVIDEVSRPITDPGARVFASDVESVVRARSEPADLEPTPPPTSIPIVDDDAPASVDVDMLSAALGTTPTDRHIAGLPSRTRTTIPPVFREDSETDDDDDGEADPNSIEDELAKRRRRRGEP